MRRKLRKACSGMLVTQDKWFDNGDSIPMPFHYPGDRPDICKDCRKTNEPDKKGFSERWRAMFGREKKDPEFKVTICTDPRKLWFRATSYTVADIKTGKVLLTGCSHNEWSANDHIKKFIEQERALRSGAEPRCQEYTV